MGVTVDEFVQGALTAADEVRIGWYATCARFAITLTCYEGTFVSPARLADATEAYLQRVEQGAGSEWLPEFRTYSCYMLNAVVVMLQDSAVTAYGQLPRYLNRVRFLAQHAQRVGVNCPALSTYLAAMDAEVTPAIAFFASRVGQVTSTAAFEYEQALQDAALFERTIAELRALGADVASIEHATSVARERVHPVLLDVLLPAAVISCGQTGNTTALIRLHNIIGPLPALQAALQNCIAN